MEGFIDDSSSYIIVLYKSPASYKNVKAYAKCVVNLAIFLWEGLRINLNLC